MITFDNKMTMLNMQVTSLVKMLNLPNTSFVSTLDSSNNSKAIEREKKPLFVSALFIW